MKGGTAQPQALPHAVVDHQFQGIDRFTVQGGIGDLGHAVAVVVFVYVGCAMGPAIKRLERGAGVVCQISARRGLNVVR